MPITVNISAQEILAEGAFVDGDKTKLDGIATGAEVNPDVVSQAEAEAGTATTERIWTAQRVAQAIAALASSGTTINNYASIGAPQVFNPDAGGVSGNTDDFTLSSTNSVALVTLDGLVLDDSEYSLTSSTLTVTPINGFSSTDQEVLVFQNDVATSATGFTSSFAQKSATYTITATDHIIEATANSFTITLPTAVGIGGQQFVIKNSGAGVVTVDGDGTETMDGNLTVILNQYEGITVASNGTNWIIIES
jgi:hypothetical protein